MVIVAVEKVPLAETCACNMCSVELISSLRFGGVRLARSKLPQNPTKNCILVVIGIMATKKLKIILEAPIVLACGLELGVEGSRFTRVGIAC